MAPKMATANSPATLATALLIPEATPDRCCATALITVVVSGATLTAMPNPSTAIGRMNDVPKETLGVAASQANPTAAIAGPIVSGNRAPKRSASAPDQRDST